MLRKITLWVLLLAAFGGWAVTAAQEAPVASGLNNPRHMALAADGTLYIAEAGSGGEGSATGPFGPVKVGTTGQITAIAPDGTQSVALSGLLSMDAGFGQVEGPTSVYPTETSLWVTLGMGPQDPGEGRQVSALAEFDLATGERLQVIDLAAYEFENNPDQAGETVSNPADIAVSADGVVYIADASGNVLYAWTEADGLSIFAVWPINDTDPQAVPTAVSVGPDGDVYVGFLSGFPFPTRGARIERYAPDGTLKETYSGLTLVTDILVTSDGTLYAVQFASQFGDLGYVADSGSVVKVTADGLEPIAEDLNFPYGLVQNAAGALLVNINSYGIASDGALITGEGAVIALEES